MRSLLPIFLLCCLTLASYSNSYADVTSEQVAKVQKLISLTGGAEIQRVSDDLKDQLINSIRPSYPKVPSAQWAKIKADMSTDELEVLTARAYLKHFDDQEIDQLIAFYQSPAGQKMQKAFPQLQRDLELAAQMWSKKQLQLVAKDLPTK